MIPHSYWETKHFFNFWDFTIIGSGITGLTTAINLRKLHPKAKITILERGILPTGASTKNAGFACFGSPSEILDDLEHMPEREVFALLEQRYKGLKELRSLLGDDKTGYQPTGGYEVFSNQEPKVYKHCLGALGYLNAELVNAIGKQAFWDASAKAEELGFSKNTDLIINKEEGIIDTGQMMKSLLAKARECGIDIYNGIEVKSLDVTAEKPELETNVGSIKTGKVVVATNGFGRKLLPGIEVEATRAQALITKPIKGLKLNGCFHHDRGYNYFRNIDGRILLGGGRHTQEETENTDEIAINESIQAFLDDLLRGLFPQYKIEIDQRWSGIMGMARSKKVIMEPLGPSTVCALRFGGMGVALGTYIGKKTAELVSGG